MKKCYKCGIEKDESEFHKNKHSKDGLYYICKKCRNKNNATSSNKKKFDFYVKLSMIRSIKHNTHGIWEKVINISLEELKHHLESQFDEKMNWNNYGIYWGVSFIIPKKFFKYNTLRSNEFLKCWNIKNLRPLPLADCKKNSKIQIELIYKYNLFDILPIGVLHIEDILKYRVDNSGKL